MRTRRVWQILVHPQLELATRQEAGARDVSLLVGVALAHIEHEQLARAGFARAP